MKFTAWYSDFYIAITLLQLPLTVLMR